MYALLNNITTGNPCSSDISRAPVNLISPHIVCYKHPGEILMKKNSALWDPYVELCGKDLTLPPPYFHTLLAGYRLCKRGEVEF